MFILHPQLDADCKWVGDLPLCRVLLLNDSQYPWLILVPRREGLRELHQLSAEEQLQYLQESNLAAGLLEELFNAEKLNIAALGNMVPQLHIHHIARFQSDVAWPKPVWGAFPAQPYSDEAMRVRVGVLQAAFSEKNNEFVAATAEGK